MSLARAQPHTTPFPAVIFRTRHRKVALAVDELVEQAEIVVKPAPDTLRSVEYVSGVTILGDGTVGLIVDTDSLAERNLIKERSGRRATA